GWRDFENRAPVFGAAAVSRSVERSVVRLHQGADRNIAIGREAGKAVQHFHGAAPRHAKYDAHVFRAAPASHAVKVSVQAEDKGVRSRAVGVPELMDG